MSKYVNILLLGVGPNANKAYLPVLRSAELNNDAVLKAAVDLTSAKQDVLERIRNHGFDSDKIAFHFSEGLTDGKLSSKDEQALDRLCERQQIHAVIIATEPLAHKAYALWALNRGLPILMDKPITARANTAHDIEAAKGIYKDYLELLEAYKQSKSTAFSIAVQRRYHPGFDLVFEKITEIQERFSIPVTSMQSQHADGQWRLPQEIITQDYHPYNIYGKVSHSGFHFLDVLARIIKTSYGPHSPKQIDGVGVFSSFVEARGLLNQLNQEDYNKIFGSEYKKLSPLTDEQLYQAYENFGEVDATNTIQLLNKGDIVGNLSLTLLHNSFARRSWILPGKDLYKGNGRVKHEYHSIQQGPFQNIQVHSYQSEDKNNVATNPHKLGGSNHFDIYVFRNKAITGGKALETFTIEDITSDSKADTIHDQVKFKMAFEFIEFLNGKRPASSLTSPFESHELAALLMSLLYQSGVQKTRVTHPLSDRILK